MRPDDPNLKHPSLIVPQRPQQMPLQSSTRSAASSQAATADIARQQLENIYADDPTHSTSEQPAPEPTPSQESTATLEPPEEPQSEHTISRSFSQQDDQQPASMYSRTHDDSTLQATPDHWNRYHSAWQDYYQQYYHRYYAAHLQQSHAALSSHQERIKQLESSTPTEITPEQAMDDMRSRLRQRIGKSAKKVRKSRHFVPIAAACLVMLTAGLLQYNRVLASNIQAYVVPSSADPTDIIVEADSSVAVGPESRLIIPKIYVNTPIIFDDTMGSTAQETYDRQMDAMKKGVSWFGIQGANSMPGQTGNMPIAGHSGGAFFDDGVYKFIFARLQSLKKDDTIYVNYKSKRYTYRVTKTQVVNPSDVAALRIGSDKPYITLITCVPIGTDNSRLLVTAEQISPDPSSAKKPMASAQSVSGDAMTGTTPTLFERMFGG